MSADPLTSMPAFGAAYNLLTLFSPELCSINVGTEETGRFPLGNPNKPLLLQ
jgi:hypothetical protein